MNQIPVISVESLVNRDSRALTVEALGNALREIGFVTLTDHGISQQNIDDLYDQCRRFFALPLEMKSKYEIAEWAGQRGYTSFGKEHAKGRMEGDLKEFWHFGQEGFEDQYTEESYLPNLICAELPSFHTAGMRMYRELERVGSVILAGIAQYLGLKADFFDQMIAGGNSILRPIHYPPITAEPKAAERAAAHEDINLITLLVGSSADGLEVLHNKGHWIAVGTNHSELVMNVGDMLQRLTNGVLKSTTHRVVNPPQAYWHLPRYSIPFFLHPRSATSLNVLPECIAADHPKRYADITAGAYLQERLREIGLTGKG